MRLYAVVVATERRGYYDALEEGCRRNGIELRVLGQGQAWRGFAWKFTLMREHLAGVDDDDVIIFLDAYDVLATQPASVVLERFLAVGTPIVVSVEDTRDTDFLTRHVRKKVFGSCPDAAVCSGAYMGRAHALRRMHDYIHDRFGYEDTMDDQRLLTAACADSAFAGGLIGYDYGMGVFYTIPQPGTLRVITASNRFVPDPRKHELRGGRLFLREAGVSPCFIHGNGNVDMDLLVDLYRLPASQDKRPMYLVGAVAHHASFLKEEMAVLFVLIVLIVWWRWRAPKVRRKIR